MYVKCFKKQKVFYADVTGYPNELIYQLGKTTKKADSILFLLHHYILELLFVRLSK